MATTSKDGSLSSGPSIKSQRDERARTPLGVHRLLFGALAITLVVPTFWRGGFSDASRSMLIVLAGILLLLVALVDGDALVRALRSPLALALGALALLTLASATWTIGSASNAVHTSLLIGAYVAIFGSASVIAIRSGALPFALLIAALAIVEAVLGLTAVALHRLPDAESIQAAWRAGGTFEYPPALALLQACSLPIFAYVLARRSVSLAAAAAAGAVLAGATLAIADSRLALGLSALFVVGMFVSCAALRRGVLVVAGLVLVGGLGSRVAFHGALAGRSSPAGLGAVAVLVALAAAAGIVAVALRRIRLQRKPGYAAALLAVVVAAGAASAVALEGRQPEGSGTRTVLGTQAHHAGLLHGRSHEWLAAIQTWLDRPVLGAGAGAYYQASSSHQTVARSVFAHDEPLELAAELGVLGLMLGAWIYAASAWGLARARRRAAVWLLGPIVFALLVSNLVDWTWHLAGLTALWAAAAGALFARTGSQPPARA